MLYKNSNFWKRLLSNFIDITIICFVSFICFYLTWNSEDKQKWISTEFIFITPFICVILFILFYWILLPFISKGKTIGMMMLKIKIISNDKKSPALSKLIARNYTIAIPFSVILIIFAFVIHNNHITVDEKTNNFVINPELFWQNLTLKTLISMINLFLLVNTIGFLGIFLNQKKISLTDLISNTRVVDQKPIFVNEKQEVKLLPFYHHKKQFEFYDFN